MAAPAGPWNAALSPRPGDGAWKPADPRHSPPVVGGSARHRGVGASPWTCALHGGRSEALGISAKAGQGGGAGMTEGGEGESSSLRRMALVATLAEDAAATELLEAAEAALGRSRRGRGEGFQESWDVQIELSASLLQRAVAVPSAEEVLEILENADAGRSGKIGRQQCAQLIEAAAAVGNSQLALSIIDAMRGAGMQPRKDVPRVGVPDRQLNWAPVDVSSYAALVRGFAAALRVQDAVEAVQSVRRCGLPAGDEVPFGKPVNCPTCQKPVAVVQPQHGCQLVACSCCRYQYELMSGDVVSCESEALTGELSALQRGLRLLRLGRRPTPAAVHSMVVKAPDGVARTHRFATETADIPAQPGERVSVASAAPESAKRRTALGLFTATTRVPGWQSGEPMALTNHATCKVSPLLRAPPKEGTAAAMGASWLLPTALLLASSDAAVGFIDPALPPLLAAGAVSAVALGGAANRLVLPRLNQLPQRSADAVAARQELLEQHEKVEQRLQQLSLAAADEVRMLARMWQLQNKMEAVGDPATYSTRLERVQLAREGLDERLTARLSLIDSYAKIASMIEIEVEMGTDLLAAEAAGAAANIAEQINRLEEVDELQKEWKINAEANDEVERLLRSAPALPDPL